MYPCNNQTGSGIDFGMPVTQFSGRTLRTTTPAFSYAALSLELELELERASTSCAAASTAPALSLSPARRVCVRSIKREESIMKAVGLVGRRVLKSPSQVQARPFPGLCGRNPSPPPARPWVKNALFVGDQRAVALSLPLRCTFLTHATAPLHLRAHPINPDLSLG